MDEPSIRLERIDPEIANQLRPRLAQLARHIRHIDRPLLLAFLGAFAGSALVGGILTSQNPASPLGLLAGIALYLACLFIGIKQTVLRRQGAAGTSLTEPIPVSEVEQAAAAVALSRTEEAYFRALIALVSRQSLLGETLSGELLGELNDLLGSHRVLEAQRQRVTAAMGPASLEQVETEHRALTERLDQAVDPATRQAIEQSLALCEERRSHAQRLAPELGRIEAQQEVIYQTLASTHGALTRMDASPTAVADPQFDRVRQSAVQIRSQTRAIEEAVQEVMALRAQ
jgi:hypothetical protein